MSEDFKPLMEYVTVASRSRDERIAALEEDANNQHDLWLKEKDKSIALEVQLELKQSIICQDETRIKLLEAELVSITATIRELEAALAKAEED